MSHVELFRVHAERNPVAVLWYEPRRPRGVSIVAGHGYSSSKHNLDLLCAFSRGARFRVVQPRLSRPQARRERRRLRGVDDCIDAMSPALRFARERGDSSAYAMGHSMGAMTALFTAALDPTMLGVDRDRDRLRPAEALAALARGGATDFRSSYVDGLDACRELVASVDERVCGAAAALAGRPALYVAADRDAMVAPQRARTLRARAGTRSRLPASTAITRLRASTRARRAGMAQRAPPATVNAVRCCAAIAVIC